MLHGSLERVCAAQLRVDDYQADSPVHHNCQADEENGACDEAGVADGVGLSNDTSTSASSQPSVLASFRSLRACVSHYAVRHVHESAPHPTPRSRTLKVIFRVKRLLSYGDARRLNSRQQWQSLHSFPPILSMCAHVVISLELNPVFAAVPGREMLKTHSVRSSWCAIRTRLRERRLPFLAIAWSGTRRCGRCRGSA
jgi:hypothetical protein